MELTEGLSAAKKAALAEGAKAGKQFLTGDKTTGPTSHMVSGSPDDLLDENWVKTAFVLPKDKFTDETDLKNRYWTSAMGKFTDGRFGCNIGVNCFSQFTPYADIPDKGRLQGREDLKLTENTGNLGMGGYWSQAFDDPEQIIYMRFGVPEFNNFFDFFTKAFNYGSSVLARTGRWPSFLYDAANFIGTYIAVTAFPLIAVAVLAYQTADYFLFRQSAKFYHMKPTMHLYWSAVNSLVNTLALNSGIYPRMMNMNADDTKRLGMPFKMDQENMDIYHRLAPDIFTVENYIDVFALANRAQRLANQLLEDEFNALNQGTATDYLGYVKSEMTGDGRHTTRISDEKNHVPFSLLVNQFLMFGKYYDAPKKEVQVETDIRTANKEDTYDPLYSEGSFNNFKKHLAAEFRSGGQFAVFRVAYTGATSESFSNSAVESDLSSKLNGMSSEFAHKRFTFGNGSAFGDVVQTMTGAATDVAMGLLSGATFGLADTIKGLLGEGFIEIPKHWQSSSASLPRAQYKLQLMAPYGNIISRIMKLFVPFAMIAAGAWPRSTGRQSYTGPFTCQLYDTGHVQIPLGMITEFSVTRGSGNVGFTTKGQPLSMEISFTVTDLSTILHMPLTAGKLFGPDPTMVDEESTLTNYLAAVAGQTVFNQIFPMTKAKIRAAKLAMQKGMISSPAFWASATHDTMTSGALKYLVVGPVIEGLSRNTEIIEGGSLN